MESCSLLKQDMYLRRLKNLRFFCHKELTKFYINYQSNINLYLTWLGTGMRQKVSDLTPQNKTIKTQRKFDYRNLGMT